MNERILELLKTGQSILKIAEALGVSSYAVRKVADNNFARPVKKRSTRKNLHMGDCAKTPRICLRCGTEFLSWGVGNRICGDCHKYAMTVDTPFMP